MEFFTVKEFQEQFDKLLERVENGEHLGIIDENENSFVMMPVDDDLMKLYVEANNEAS